MASCLKLSCNIEIFSSNLFSFWLGWHQQLTLTLPKIVSRFSAKTPFVRTFQDLGTGLDRTLAHSLAVQVLNLEPLEASRDSFVDSSNLSKVRCSRPATETDSSTRHRFKIRFVALNIRWSSKFFYTKLHRPSHGIFVGCTALKTLLKTLFCVVFTLMYVRIPIQQILHVLLIVGC